MDKEVDKSQKLNRRGNLPGRGNFKPPRDKRGCILPGSPGGPGRKKGSVGGRTRALLLLDEILGDSENLEKLRRSLLKYFNKNPVRFFRKFVVPLVPKEALIKLESTDKARVRILFDNESPSEDDGQPS